MAGQHTLVSVGRDGRHDSRQYATDKAAVDMARWLACLRRYRSHVLVAPDGTVRQLTAEGEHTSLSLSRPVQVGLDFEETEKRIIAWLTDDRVGSYALDKSLTGRLPEEPGFLRKRQAGGNDGQSS